MPRSPVNSTSVFLYDSTLSGMRYLVWGMSYLVGYLGFPGGSTGKESACNVGDLSSIPGLGRSPGEGNSCPLQYSGLENSMDCIAHGVAKSWTQLSDFHGPKCWRYRSEQNKVRRLTCGSYFQIQTWTALGPWT